MPKPRLIALDTNVLIDRAAGKDTVVDFIETVRERIQDAQFVVPTYVIIELADMADHGDSQEKKLATQALLCMRQWGFFPLTCVPVGNGIVEETGRKLRVAGLIPEEEVHDSFVVAEAALADATLLVSNDTHIRDIDQTLLKLELERCDLNCPLMASPWKIVHDFFRR